MKKMTERPKTRAEVPPGLRIPEIHNDLTRRDFLAAGAAAMLLGGCGRGGGGESSGETQTVEHAFGTVDIPMSPARIASLWNPTTSALISLGMDPAAAATPEMLVPGIDVPEGFDPGGIEDVGEHKNSNLESVARTEPDLIIGTAFDVEEIYDELSQIAPTLALDWGGTGAWKQHVEDVARTLGLEEGHREVLDEYEARVDEVREAIGAERVEGIEVSLMRLQSSSAEVRLEILNSFPGQVVSDVGLARPESQDVTEEETGFVAISLERLPSVDADELFVLRYEGMEEDEEYLSRIQSNPLWDTLEAVQSDSAHVVDYDAWGASNYFAAHGVLDDLERILGQ